MQQNNNTCTTRSVSQSVKEKTKAQITLAQNAITKTKTKQPKDQRKQTAKTKDPFSYRSTKMDIEN
jgi:hypothetical protein